MPFVLEQIRGREGIKNKILEQFGLIRERIECEMQSIYTRRHVALQNNCNVPVPNEHRDSIDREF